jgi:hypothetical protein
MNHTLPMMISMNITPKQTNWDDPSLWLPYCFLLFMFSFGPCTYAVLEWETVIFNEQPSIAMSESSWKIVTEWAPEEELQTISGVELLIQQLSDIAARQRRDVELFHEKDVSSTFRDSSSFMAEGKIETKVPFFSTLLNMKKWFINVHYILE